MELSSEDGHLFVIPEGFAHGFQVLEENSELLYLHTKEYNKEHEGALNYNDPTVGIKWPLPATELSERDKQHSYISEEFTGIDI